MDPAEVGTRAQALGQRLAKPDDEVTETPAAPIVAPSGFVDLVFSEGRLRMIRDHRGLETEVGRWLEQGEEKVLRLPWPTTRDELKASVPAARPHYLRPPASNTTEAQVLGLLIADWRDYGQGLTDEQLAARASKTVNQVAPRRNELHDRGWVQVAPLPGTTRKQKPCKRWELTPEGAAELNLRR